MRPILRYWRVAIVAIVPFCVYLIPHAWLFDEGHTVCLWHNLTGAECWGCGMTRALVSVCYFDFTAAWEYHKAVVVVAPLLVWIWISWIRNIIRREQKKQI